MYRTLKDNDLKVRALRARELREVYASLFFLALFFISVHCEESKFEELKRLDCMVQNYGTLESLCAGIGGALVFGLDLCLAMQVIGSGVLTVVLGVLLGIIGMVSMIVAYPIYRKVFTNAKTKYAPRILELTAELTGGKNSAL